MSVSERFTENTSYDRADAVTDTTFEEKKARLCQIISELGGCVIAFSGGVDSSLLFALATELLGDQALAVTATSETYPISERIDAERLAALIGGRHTVIVSEELDIPGFAENRPDRCYHCKHELFAKLSAVAIVENLPWVIDGSNMDDRADYRPGKKAAQELHVRSPLDEAGFTKEDIRRLSREKGLFTWNKPAFACLSSRFPYGSPITVEKVRQVAMAEEGLRSLGFSLFRVRHHDTVARVEFGPDEFRRAVSDLRQDVLRIVHAAGYPYVAVDLKGYRTGAMNEVLP